MKLSSLTVQNVRIHESYAVAINETVTLITGMNGTGKTSLIEAIYIALRGRSFKGPDEAIKRHETDWYRIDLTTDAGVRTVKYDARTALRKKTYTIDTKTVYRLTERYKYPIVLFEPDDLRMTDGSPARRRDFIDTIITQYDPHYAPLLRKYERALFQRNKLLKSDGVTEHTFFPWNILLSNYGADIITKRHELIEQLNRSITEVYQTIAPTTDEIALHYSYAPHTSLAQRLLAEYEQSFDRDKMLKNTSVGPHRHDMLLTINGDKAADVASRGENRTIVLAIKFIEAAIIEVKTQLKPLILLDDVFSELDDARQKLLLKEFHDNQVIMTSASTKSRSLKHVVSLDDKKL
jgi:DNA replication and repair protein RecF